MSKITSVEPQIKNPHRYNIFLDGVFVFGADEDTVVNFRLIVGKELNEEDLNKLVFETEVGKLMERMYGLFSRRDRSEKEVRDYLRNLSFKRKIKDQDVLSEIVVEKLIERLKQKDLINDLRFAQNWAQARRNSQKKGINAIKFELYQKGIDKQITEQVLSVKGEGESEESLAKQAIEKKLRSWRNLNELEFKQKAIQFLIRKGFDYSVAKDVVINFLKDPGSRF